MIVTVIIINQPRVLQTGGNTLEYDNIRIFELL